jgi:hypothetical protein
MIMCVYLKGYKYGTNNCHWVVVFKHCISFEMHLSTLKFASNKGASNYKFLSFTQDNDV